MNCYFVTFSCDEHTMPVQENDLQGVDFPTVKYNHKSYSYNHLLHFQQALSFK